MYYYYYQEMETCLEHVKYLENKLTETQNTLKEKG